MKLLLPLGLLGLLGIVALIIIYIIKPNFQQKLISSTFIWRLSLKYKKKRIPLSRLRNILLVICQVLIITAAVLILTKPVNVLQEAIEQPETVLILDSSASMRTENEDGITRFERAVDLVKEEAERIFDKDGIVSILLAEKTPTYLIERAGATDRDVIADQLDELLEGDTSCSYGSSDINLALSKTESVLAINPAAKISVYTDTEFSYVPENIGYVNVKEDREWNAAILNATAKFEDNYYAFYVDVACYGIDLDLEVNLDIYGVNAIDALDTSAGEAKFSQSVHCAGDEPVTVIFKYVPEDEEEEFLNALPDNAVYSPMASTERVFSYKSVHIGIEEEDSMTLDNNFNIYSGLKQVIKVQYYSAGKDPSTGQELSANNFFQEALTALQKIYADRWDIQVTEIKRGSPYATEGYDFYIFEHTMPDVLPTDGFVLLSDPMNIPGSFGVQYQSIVDFNKKSVYLAAESSHPILNGLSPTDISVSRYVKLASYDSSYEMLLSYAGDPMLLVRNEENAHVAILCFSLHYSNLSMLTDFPLLMDHLFNYYLPCTVVGNAFEVQDPVSLNCRSNSLEVSDGRDVQTYTSFPTTVSFDLPGDYSLTQTTFGGNPVTERIYVRMPAAESNVSPKDNALQSPYFEVDESDYFDDLLLYLAIALLSLLTVEWYLQHKENSL